MANSNKPKAKELDGFFIYHDDKGRVIYSNPFQKNGYIINNFETKSYLIYSSGWIFAIAIAGLLYYFFSLKVIVAFAIGIAIYVIFNILFYVKFLPSLNVIKNYNKPKRPNFFYRNIDKQSNSKVLIIFFIGIVLSTFIIINAIQSKFEGSILYLNLALAVGIMAYSVYDIYIFFKRKSKDNRKLKEMFKDDMKANIKSNLENRKKNGI